MLLARNSAAAESEGGEKFIPPTPLSFCPPECQISFLPREARQPFSFCQKMFERSCIIPPVRNLQAVSVRLASLRSAIKLGHMNPKLFAIIGAIVLIVIL